jgi:hypothetical protein
VLFEDFFYRGQCARALDSLIQQQFHWDHPKTPDGRPIVGTRRSLHGIPKEER